MMTIWTEMYPDATNLPKHFSYETIRQICKRYSLKNYSYYRIGKLLDIAYELGQENYVEVSEDPLEQFWQEMGI